MFAKLLRTRSPRFNLWNAIESLAILRAAAVSKTSRSSARQERRAE
jgi:hypothetical protein